MVKTMAAGAWSGTEGEASLNKEARVNSRERKGGGRRNGVWREEPV
jgi:hypothetical protein